MFKFVCVGGPGSSFPSRFSTSHLRQGTDRVIFLAHREHFSNALIFFKSLRSWWCCVGLVSHEFLLSINRSAGTARRLEVGNKNRSDDEALQEEREVVKPAQRTRHEGVAKSWAFAKPAVT